MESASWHMAMVGLLVQPCRVHWLAVLSAGACQNPDLPATRGAFRGAPVAFQTLRRKVWAAEEQADQKRQDRDFPRLEVCPTPVANRPDRGVNGAPIDQEQESHDTLWFQVPPLEAQTAQ
jgi:hypothetical protein